MPSRIAVYLMRGNGRSQRMGRAMAKGILAAGDLPIVRDDGQYIGPQESIAVFYGYEKNMPRIMSDYVAAGRVAVFLDLGYWGRRVGGRFRGFHKVAINARHPGPYFYRRPMPPDRVRQFNLAVRPYRKQGEHILIAGMSGKAAATVGMEPNAWERTAIAKLRQHTNRPIIYRPKPSWLSATRLDGADWSPPSQPLESALKNAWAVVTHHSNVAIDGLVAGIPAFCADGAAVPMALHDLARIESPLLPDGREQWLANLAYCQWSVAEMENGTLWRYLKREGLIQ